MNMTAEDASRVGMDIGFSINLLVNSTLALGEFVCRSLREYKPHCIIADSMAAWGRFAALKLGIPFISPATTFAFNRHSAKVIKQSFPQLLAMLKAMPAITMT